jgi:multidrug efflux system membrane fusion protein
MVAGVSEFRRFGSVYMSFWHRIFHVALAASLLTACGRRAPREAAVPPVPVEAGVVERRTVPVELRAIGAVEPLATVQLKARVQGEITQVLFADGAYVKAGQPLFTIDPRPFDATLRRVEADYKQAQTQAQNAQDQADRYTKLTTQGVASKEQFAQYLTTASSQKALVAARQADLDQAKLSLDWTTVRAPISGRAGAALLKTGNIVQANADVLTIINQTQPLYVSFSIPEKQLADVRAWIGKGPVRVTAYHPESGKSLGTGTLDFVDNVVDRQSGMIALKATFPNADESLWPGQFVDVVVNLTDEHDALVVRSTAIMEGQNGSQVFVIKDGTATLQKVTVERTVGDYTVVLTGLEQGQTVVTSGQLRVASGAKVVVADEQGAPATKPKG